MFGGGLKTKVVTSTTNVLARSIVDSDCDYVINKQFNSVTYPFKSRTRPPPRLKTTHGFHAELDSSGSPPPAKSERHITLISGINNQVKLLQKYNRRSQKEARTPVRDNRESRPGVGGWGGIQCM